MLQCVIRRLQFCIADDYKWSINVIFSNNWGGLGAICGCARECANYFIIIISLKLLEKV